MHLWSFVFASIPPFRLNVSHSNLGSNRRSQARNVRRHPELCGLLQSRCANVSWRFWGPFRGVKIGRFKMNIPKKILVLLWKYLNSIGISMVFFLLVVSNVFFALLHHENCGGKAEGSGMVDHQRAEGSYWHAGREGRWQLQVENRRGPSDGENCVAAGGFIHVKQKNDP